MNDYNKEEKKGGFWSALSGLFRGGSSAMGGASSGLGSAGGLFATKAGIVGMVLGGATIAAGVGVVYNFVGPSSKPVYSPELFQNSYYEEEASKAGQERAQARNTSAAEASTLDMFKEQAKKDGLGLAGESSGEESAEPAASGASPSADAEAPAAPAGSEMAAGSGAPKLQAGAGFGGKGGAGGGSSAPRMQGGGGLSGGIGGQFQSVYRAPAQANAGKTSAMTASAARVNSSPKYAVPNFNKKGAYGQAKYAGKMGAKAAYSADGAGARTAATNAFSGETSGSGDVGATGMGAGLGGAGISSGNKLKGNDPSLNANNSTPPKVPDPKKENPWQATEDRAMKFMMISAGLVLLATLLGKIKASVIAYYACMATAALAVIAALVVIAAGIEMMTKYGQKMMGGIYIAAGIMLIIGAWNAVCGAAGNNSGANAPTGGAPWGATSMAGNSFSLGSIFSPAAAAAK